MEEEKKKNPLLVLLIIINSIFVIFILVKQFQINELSENSQQDSAVIEVEEAPTLYKGLKRRDNHTFGQIEFKEMHANFKKDTGPKRFLKLSFILIVETPESAPMAETNSLKPKIRDSVFSLINSIKTKEALRLEGRNSFKIKLMNRVNKVLNKDQVKRVLFKTFLVK